jgi:hypothetical protein
MKEIKQVYIGSDITLSNNCKMITGDICTFKVQNQETMLCHVYNDRTGDDLGVFYYNEESKWFMPLSIWRQQQINSILDD